MSKGGSEGRVVDEVEIFAGRDWDWASWRVGEEMVGGV